MAERRMFAKTIIDSDAFLDMPMSTQCLYFHLSMRADDEGFINNPKKIQRMIGATEDDLKLLIVKRFVLAFESGVIVIKHWKIHNYIRNDRLSATQYQEERALIDVKENGAYTMKPELLEAEDVEEEDARKKAYSESDLPYSFGYKMKRAFEGRKCPVCNMKMTGAVRNRVPSVQHNVPISKGGRHELENISVICAGCNSAIRDNETGDLNNAEVITVWDRIVELEKNGVEWFWDLDKLWGDFPMSDTCQASGGQVTDKCQHRLGKDSIGKVSIGKDRLINTTTTTNGVGGVAGGCGCDEEKSKAEMNISTIYQQVFGKTASVYEIDSVFLWVQMLNRQRTGLDEDFYFTEDDRELLEIAFEAAAKAGKKNIGYIHGVYKNLMQRRIYTTDAYWADEFKRNE